MLALVFDGKPVLRDDYPAPVPGEGEALVAVRMAGVCGTDLQVAGGYMDFRGVMGHEFVGEVVQGPARWKHKRVVAEICCVCGTCDMCTSGLSNHCRSRSVLGIDGHDGVFAEYVCVPVRNLHEVPAGVGDAEATFAEPLAAALQVVRQVGIDAGARAVVLGDGRLGQLVARVLKNVRADLLLVGKYAAKLEAAEKVGIRTAALETFRPDAAADVVVDATGSPAGIELALRTVRPRGTIILKTTAAAAAPVNLAPLVVNEVTLIGSRCGPFAAALRALADGDVDVSALISRRFALARATDALEAAAADNVIKVLIDVQ